MGSNLEKYGKFWKNECFSGRIWPDWGNTAWADMAGLGSIGLRPCRVIEVTIEMADDLLSGSKRLCRLDLKGDAAISGVY